MAIKPIVIKSSGKKGSAGFSPTPLSASPGDTVTWQNTDIIQHWPTPKTGPAWFNQAINPNITSLPVSVPQNTDYFCKLHPTETGSIQVSGAPQIVELTIVSGSLPNATINVNDSVFWLNNTSDNYQLYTIVSGNQIPWGVPPDLLPPHQPSSQVVFPKSGIFAYQCKLHPGQKGSITVL
jgi:plastocyanin